jgi:hypothetical protein
MKKVQDMRFSGTKGINFLLKKELKNKCSKEQGLWCKNIFEIYF